MYGHRLKEPLLHELNQLIEHLCQYRDALAADETESLRSLLREGKERKEIADHKGDAP